RIYEEGKENIPECPYLYETDAEICLVGGSCKSPIERFWKGSSPVYVVQKAVENESREGSELEEALSVSELFPKESPGPAALPVGEAKLLLSFYNMVLNPNMTHLGGSDRVVLPPLWVRCDGSDPEHTVWMGTEPLTAGEKTTGINIYMVSCDGPKADKNCFTSLEELKMQHKRRHHSSVVTTRGFAQYELIKMSALEDTRVDSGSNLYVDFTWNNVEKVLQIPPLTSDTTLNILLESGNPRSPVFHLYQELQLLLALAEGLKTGETEWPEPAESESALELIREFLTDLKKQMAGDCVSGKKNETEPIQCDTAAGGTYIQSLLGERGLDFAEQLWCRMRGVSSHQELIDCFTLVIKSLERGEIQPWIRQGSSSLLCKLIHQSYHGKMEVVSLSGITPIQMLLEIGLDKIKRDYVIFFLGQELATLTSLDYFTSTSVALQEQVDRVQKLHHMVEIMANCRVLLQFRHESLFPLTQICMKYYKENPLKEKHVFQLPIRAALLKRFYQNKHPDLWKVEISSGQGPKEVKTVWEVSTNPPAEHVASNNSGLSCDSPADGSSEEKLFYITVTKCSQVPF
ncbi:ZWILC protein, partial [Pitta sordida]|nr:ZWILC protein [Pitta sordida]